ncbi:MAG: hypothetical protein KAI17_24440 [Thiotrichaceae bacterium]|nr:hypothetical protein [Thiotrichaceae bacterium]
MKTNQMMSVQIGKDFVLNIEHKTKMGSLNGIWAYGNSLRIAKGKKALSLEDYPRSPETCEYIIEVERFLNLTESVDSKSGENPELEIVRTMRGGAKITGGKLTCLKTKKGRYGGTWANLFILLDAATKLDVDFKVLVYDAFINKRIHQTRNDIDNSFKALNIAIDNHMPANKGIGMNKEYYITIANKVAERIKPLGGDWNASTAKQLSERDAIIKQLIGFLEMDMVTSFEHLCQLVEKIKVLI